MMEKKTIFTSRFFFFVLFLCALFYRSYPLEKIQDAVLSPISGLWANYQSLVLDLPEGAEAFYSLNGDDPAESGLAYDGPVVLTVAGKVPFRLVVQDVDGNVFKVEIPYTVVLKENPPYIPQPAFPVAEPFLCINASSSVEIPESVSYTLGGAPVLFTGRRLFFNHPSVFERYLPLVVYDGEVPFRYILRTGADMVFKDSNLPGADFPDNVPVEFDNWNCAVFKTEFPLIYFLDDGPVRVSDSARIYMDRTKDHTLHWRIDEGSEGTEFKKLFIPKRPELAGLPSVPAVNKAVHISFKEADFLFCFTTHGGEKLYSPVFTVDVLEGDAFGFSEDVEVYYKGVRQGSLRPSFIVDKIPPSPPVFISSEKKYYARQTVMTDIQGGDFVYCYLCEPLRSKRGFSRSDIERINGTLKPVRYDKFTRFTPEHLKLEKSETEALLYTVYAYTLDAAGNKSETVRFQKVVDAVNYYVSNINADTRRADFGSRSADGSPDNPFHSFSSLYEGIRKFDSSFIRCIVHGVFTGIPSLVIERDTEICGNGKTRLQFEKGASLIVRNAFFALKDCTLEQHCGGAGDIFQSYLVEADNAVLSFSGSELICKDANSASCFSVNASSLDIEKTGITVEAPVYAQAVSAKTSVVHLQDVRTLVICGTGVGLKSVQSSVALENSSFRLSGNLVRALEFVDSNFTLSGNKFISEKNMDGLSAVWTNIFAASKPFFENTYSGFSSLYGGL